MKTYLFALLFIPFISQAQVYPSTCFDRFFGTHGSAQVDITPNISSVMASEALLIEITPNIFGIQYCHYMMQLNKDGKIDSSFGTNGRDTINISGYGPVSSISFTKEQPDGKIIAGITAIDSSNNNISYPTFLLVRLTAKGALDTPFNKIVIPPKTLDSMYGIVYATIQPDGKILICGVPNNTYTYELIRYNSNGSIDTTFGMNGRIHNLTTASMLLQPDGKILIAENLSSANLPYQSCLVRFNSNGTFDSTFGNYGIALDTTIGNSSNFFNTYIQKIALTPNGILCLAKNSIIAYKSNGTLDKSYGSSGQIYYYSDGLSGDITLQQDGKMIFVYSGYTPHYIGIQTIARYNTDGTLDNTFGANGMITDTTTYDPGHFSTDLWYVHVQSTGKVLVGGAAYQNSYNSVFFNRYYADQYNEVPIVTTSKINVSIYPNPTIDGLFKLGISGYNGVADIRVTDVLGKTIWMSTHDFSTSSATSINISQYPVGVYLVKVKTANNKEAVMTVIRH